MINPEVVLKVGAEGGHLTLYGVRTGSGRQFSFETYDCAALFLDEDDLADLPPEHQKPILERSAPVTSWEEAIALLDRCPWENLHPEFVHPEFRKKVWEIIEGRLGHGGSPRRWMPSDFRKRALNLWRRVCDGLEG